MATKKTYEEGLKAGAEIAAEAFKPELERLRNKVRELQLEISLNKREWRTVKIVELSDR